MESRYNLHWERKEDEKLKTIFLIKGKLFSVGRFAMSAGRTSRAISTRISCMIDPRNYRLYDKNFAIKVKEIFPNQGVDSDLDRILNSRGCYL